MGLVAIPLINHHGLLCHVASGDVASIVAEVESG